jgi:hypothetical protein
VVLGLVAAGCGNEPSRRTHDYEAGLSNSLRVECKLFHRPAVTRQLRVGPTIRLSTRRRTARVRAGSFAFVVKLLSEPANAEPTSLSIRVTQRMRRKTIAAGLYQKIAKNMYDRTRHGFTGLLYAYTPTGAELQYFCRSL